MGTRIGVSAGVVLLLAFACGARSALDLGPPSAEGNQTPLDAGASDSLPVPAPVPDAHVIDAGPCQRDAGGGGGPAWLYDECLWEAVPALADCQVYQARLPDQGYPPLSWSACGSGCRVLEPNLLVPYVPHTSGYYWAERAWADQQQLYTKLEIGSSETPRVQMIVRLEPLEVLAAFQARHILTSDGYADCGDFKVTDDFGPQLMLMWSRMVGGDPKDDSDSVQYFARSRYRETWKLEPILGSYVENPGWDTSVAPLAVTTTSWSYYLEGYFYVTDQWTTLPPHTTKIKASGWAAYRSFGDQFYWLKGDGVHYTSVQRWSPGSGVSEVLQRPETVWIIDAVWGANGLVWLEGKNIAESSKFADLSVWRLADPVGSPAGAATKVATLDGEASPGIVSGGGYVATIACSDATFDNKMTPDKCPLVVIRLADAKVWTLGPPAVDRWWHEPRFVDDKRLLIGDNDVPHFSDHGRRLYLLDIDQLDALEQQFPASGPASK